MVTTASSSSSSSASSACILYKHKKKEKQKKIRERERREEEEEKEKNSRERGNFDMRRPGSLSCFGISNRLCFILIYFKTFVLYKAESTCFFFSFSFS